MAWPTWKACALPLESAVFPTVSWSHLVVALAALRRKVRLTLPCIGSASSIDDQVLDLPDDRGEQLRLMATGSASVSLYDSLDTLWQRSIGVCAQSTPTSGYLKFAGGLTARGVTIVLVLTR